MTYDWMVGVDTMTENEGIEYFLDGDKVVIVMDGVKNFELRFNREQVLGMICGLSGLLAKMDRSS